MVTLELRFTWAFGKSLGEPERGGFRKEFEHVVADSMGIHARPAVFIRKDEKRVEATKLMAIMGLGVKCGQKVGVEVSGPDEDAAYAGMKKFFEENL